MFRHSVTLERANSGGSVISAHTLFIADDDDFCSENKWSENDL